MRVSVLFFGLLKEIVGTSQETIEVADGAQIETVFQHFATQYPQLHELAHSIVPARNMQFARFSDPVEEGDEIAFMPPVSGGNAENYPYWIREEQTGNFYALTREPINVQQLLHELARPEDGAIVEFRGIVRNHKEGRKVKYLEYDCYEPMAIRVMAQIGSEISRQYPISRLAVVHRLGRLEVGAVSVVVAVASEHRKPAFQAALETINRLKQRVPIWKKEVFDDGQAWVEGEWDKALFEPKES